MVDDNNDSPSLIYNNQEFPKGAEASVKKGELYYSIGDTKGNVYIQVGHSNNAEHEPPHHPDVTTTGYIADVDLSFSIYDGYNGAVNIINSEKFWNFLRIGSVTS